MRRRILLLVAVAVAVCSNAAAQTIFNIQPEEPEAQQGQSAAPTAGNVPTSAPQPVVQSMPLVTERAKQPMQYDRQPNESLDAYVQRMNALSQHAIDDMQRVLHESQEKMKAMTAK